MTRTLEARAALESAIDNWIPAKGGLGQHIRLRFPSSLITEWHQAAGIQSLYSNQALEKEAGLWLFHTPTIYGSTNLSDFFTRMFSSGNIFYQPESHRMWVRLTPDGGNEQLAYRLEFELNKPGKLEIPTKKNLFGLATKVEWYDPNNIDLQSFNAFLNNAVPEV